MSCDKISYQTYAKIGVATLTTDITISNTIQTSWVSQTAILNVFSNFKPNTWNHFRYNLFSLGLCMFYVISCEVRALCLAETWSATGVTDQGEKWHVCVFTCMLFAYLFRIFGHHTRSALDEHELILAVLILIPYFIQSETFAVSACFHRFAHHSVYWRVVWGNIVWQFSRLNISPMTTFSDIDSHLGMTSISALHKSYDVYSRSTQNDKSTQLCIWLIVRDRRIWNISSINLISLWPDPDGSQTEN